MIVRTPVVEEHPLVDCVTPAPEFVTTPGATNSASTKTRRRVAHEDVAQLLAEIEAAQEVEAATRAEAETAQREALEAGIALADLNAKALLLEEQKELEKATKNVKHKHKKR